MPQQMETTRIVFLFNGFIALKRLTVSISAVDHGIKQLREINITQHFFPANPAEILRLAVNFEWGFSQIEVAARVWTAFPDIYAETRVHASPALNAVKLTQEQAGLADNTSTSECIDSVPQVWRSYFHTNRKMNPITGAHFHEFMLQDARRY